MTFVATRQNENEFSFALATPKVHLLLINASSAALGNNQTSLSLHLLAR